MKRLFLVIIFSHLLFSSCKKGIIPSSKDSYYLQNVKEVLYDSLPQTDFMELDYARAKITNPNSATNYLKIPFKGRLVSEEFILLRTDFDGNVLAGLIINLKEIQRPKTA